MKKFIPIIMLIVGFQSIAQVRISGANERGSVSIELGGNTNYYRDRHYPTYIRPYEYLRLSARQEARLYDLLHALEGRRLSQRAYDDMLHRDLSRILDRRQYAMWQDRYYAPRYRTDNRGHHRGHQHKEWNRHANKDKHFDKDRRNNKGWENRRG